MLERGNFMYETSGVIDESFFQLIKYDIIPKKIKKIIACCCMIIFLCIIACAFFKLLLAFIVSVSGLVMFCITYYLVLKRTLKLSVQRLKETTNRESYVVTTKFLEDGVVILTDYSEEEKFFKYNNLDTLIETKICYLLFTKSLQYIIVFKEQLTESEKKGLIEFLKSKSIKIDTSINL
jgi:hypothetical protein